MCSQSVTSRRILDGYRKKRETNLEYKLVESEFLANDIIHEGIRNKINEWFSVYEVLPLKVSSPNPNHDQSLQCKLQANYFHFTLSVPTSLIFFKCKILKRFSSFVKFISVGWNFLYFFEFSENPSKTKVWT